MFWVMVVILIVFCIFLKKAIDKKEAQKFREARRKTEEKTLEAKNKWRENSLYDDFLQEIFEQIGNYYNDAQKSALPDYKADILRICLSKEFGIFMFHTNDEDKLNDYDKDNIEDMCVLALRFSDYGATSIREFVHFLGFRDALEGDIRKYCKDKCGISISAYSLYDKYYMIDLNLKGCHPALKNIMDM